MRVRRGWVLALGLLALVPGTTEPVARSIAAAAPSPDATAPATGLAKPPIPTDGAYLGASASVHNGETRTQAIERTERQIGRRLAIDHQFYRWDQPLVNSTQHDDAAAGRYPFVSWKPQRNNGEIITWTSVARGDHDTHIRSYARTMRDFGHPMFATFHHEPTDEAGRWGSSGDFVAAFRHVVDLFRAEGAHNVAWVLVLTSWDYTQGRGDAWYPGPDHVDWIAADPYNFHQRDGRWDTLEFVARDFYEWGSRTGKPLMLAEWGSTEDPAVPGRKAQWFDQAAATLAGWPNIRAAVYFNNLHAGFDWRIDTSPAALEAFRRLANHPHFSPSAVEAAPPQPPPQEPTGPLDCDGGADHFTDVGPYDVLRRGIECVAAYGIVEGTTPTTFEPSRPVTRGQAATFFANTLEAAGVLLPPPAAPFADGAGDVHEDAMRRLAALGIIQGFPDGSYRPEGLVNRAQVATFLVRAHNEIMGARLRGAPRLFRDTDGSVHAANIDKAAQAGLLAGTAPGVFSPDDDTSRAQLAAILARLLRLVAEAGVPISTA